MEFNTNYKRSKKSDKAKATFDLNGRCSARGIRRMETFLDKVEVTPTAVPPPRAERRT